MKNLKDVVIKCAYGEKFSVVKDNNCVLMDELVSYKKVPFTDIMNVDKYSKNTALLGATVLIDFSSKLYGETKTVERPIYLVLRSLDDKEMDRLFNNKELNTYLKEQGITSLNDAYFEMYEWTNTDLEPDGYFAFVIDEPEDYYTRDEEDYTLGNVRLKEGSFKLLGNK